MTDWYESSSVGETHPAEVDTTSSPTVAYQRRNFTSEVNEDGNTVWTYEERTMPHAEYSRVRIAELETAFDILTGGETA